MEQQPPRACEWTKSKKNKKNKVTSYSNWRRVLSFDLAHKQCNIIIKGWFNCLTSASKGRFLANNILSEWCLVMAQIQFSLINLWRTVPTIFLLSRYFFQFSISLIRTWLELYVFLNAAIKLLSIFSMVLDEPKAV